VILDGLEDPAVVGAQRDAVLVSERVQSNDASMRGPRRQASARVSMAAISS
jgi:hypothetical protein